MAVLPTDYTDTGTVTGATYEYPATTARGLNATHTQINQNTSDIATKASLTGTETLTNKTIDSASNTIIVGAVQQCRVLTGTETFTISGGNVTQIAGTTISGVAVNVGDRICVHSAPASSGTGVWASSQPGNGIYTVTSNTTNISLARAADMSGSFKPGGRCVLITDGSAIGDIRGVITPSDYQAAFTYGTNNIAWSQSGTQSIVTTWDVQTLTNKRITRRVNSVTNTTSWTINSDTTDFAENTGLTGAVTINNPSGTPTQGQPLWITLTGTASRAISYGTAFEDSTVVRPTTTSGTAALDIGFRWNSVTSKWRCVAYA